MGLSDSISSKQSVGRGQTDHADSPAENFLPKSNFRTLGNGITANKGSTTLSRRGGESANAEHSAHSYDGSRLGTSVEPEWAGSTELRWSVITEGLIPLLRHTTAQRSQVALVMPTAG